VNPKQINIYVHHCLSEHIELIVIKGGYIPTKCYHVAKCVLFSATRKVARKSVHQFWLGNLGHTVVEGTSDVPEMYF